MVHDGFIHHGALSCAPLPPLGPVNPEVLPSRGAYAPQTQVLLMACNRLVTGFVSLKLVTAVITTGTALKRRLKGRDCDVPERAASTLPASISVPSARVYVPRSKTRTQISRENRGYQNFRK